MRASDYPYQHLQTVTFQDLDAMRHVNNVTYMVYLETARINYMHALFNFPSFDALPIVLGDIYCRYQSPAFYMDQLTVGVGVNRFGRKSFDFIYQIENQHGTPVAAAKCTMVSYDYATNQTVEVPANIRDAVTKFQGNWHHSFVV